MVDIQGANVQGYQEVDVTASLLGIFTFGIQLVTFRAYALVHVLCFRSVLGVLGVLSEEMEVNGVFACFSLQSGVSCREAQMQPPQLCNLQSKCGVME
jgi:hypothetical protein